MFIESLSQRYQLTLLSARLLLREARHLLARLSLAAGRRRKLDEREDTAAKLHSYLRISHVLIQWKNEIQPIQ
jgi:hypothetical protein